VCTADRQRILRWTGIFIIPARLALFIIVELRLTVGCYLLIRWTHPFGIYRKFPPFSTHFGTPVFRARRRDKFKDLVAGIRVHLVVWTASISDCAGRLDPRGVHSRLTQAVFTIRTRRSVLICFRAIFESCSVRYSSIGCVPDGIYPIFGIGGNCPCTRPTGVVNASI
ncbi:unnamed protein product, partial [Tilletia controversa]